MNSIFGMTAMVGTLVLASSGLGHAATLCAKSGTASATVVTPAQGTTCRTGESPIPTEPPAVTARQGSYFNGVRGTFNSLDTPVFVTVKEPGMYVMVASGAVHNAEVTVNENGVIQCRLKKRTAAGQLVDALSTSLTVQTIKRYAHDPMATTATGYFYAGEGAELTCQVYSESTWKFITVGFKELKLTAVKVSSVSETVIPQFIPPVR